MSNWKAEWSGSYPNLCRGKWTLYMDGDVVDTEIPFQGNEANTHGIYDEWYFGEDYDEQWDSYSDGLECEAWCKEYKDWLSTIAAESEWSDIYDAFNAEDWRLGSCAGCV